MSQAASETLAKVYVETTIPSYLAARPSRDLMIAAHQQVTWDWWDSRRAAFQLYISEVVEAEARAGDASLSSHGSSSWKAFPFCL